MTSNPDIDGIAERWHTRLQQALLTIVNQQRRASNTTALRLPVVLPGSSAATELYLLNLRVWTLRYSVSPEFVLEAILIRYPDALRVDKKCVLLALPAARLGGVAAREAVEQAVRRTYPNGENWRATNSPTLINIIPPTHLDLDHPEASLHRYRNKILRVRRKLEEQRTSIRRNYRKLPQ